MDWNMLWISLLIILARITDVSIGTVRTLFIVHGHRGIAFLLGFFESLIWIVVVSGIIRNLHHPVYILSYGLGFALGTYLGMTIESLFARGEQALRVFTRHGDDVADRLRARGFVVTQFEGRGREGPISMVFLQASRRSIRGLLRLMPEIDPACFYMVDDIRLASGGPLRYPREGGVRGILKKK